MTLRPGPRSLGAVLAWGLATFGLGFAWYYFTAFREVDVAERRRHSALIFLGLVPFVGPFFLLMYARDELRSLDAGRQRLGLAPGILPGEHAGLFVLGLLPSISVAILLLAQGHEGWGWLGVMVLGSWSPCVPVPRVVADVNGYWAARGIHSR